MKKIVIIENVIATLLTIFFLLPFLYITKFTYLAADDFCRGTATWGNYFSNVYDWYMIHNGRFVNAFLGYLPIYDLPLYRAALAISMVFSGISIFLFCRAVIRFSEVSSKIISPFLMAVVIIIVLLGQLPSVYEFFYWYAGSSSYLLTLTFFLLLLSTLLSGLTSNLKTLISGILVVLIIGNNEMLIGLTNLLLMGLLFRKFVRKEQVKRIFFLNILSWFASALIIFSPGSIERSTYFPKGGNLFYSVSSAFLSSGMFILKSLIEFPYFLLYASLFFYILVVRSKENLQRRAINPMVFLLCSFFGLTSVLFIPYYATGHLNLNDGRIGNMVHAIFLILLFLNLYNLALHIKIREIKIIKELRIAPSIVFMISLIMMILSNPNFQKLWGDWQNKRFSKFTADMEERRKLVESPDKSRLVLKGLKGTEILQYQDLSPDPAHWSNQCLCRMIKDRTGKEIKSLRIQKE